MVLPFIALLLLARSRGVAVGVTERHISRGNRSCQIHVLRLIAVGGRARPHDPDIDFLNQVGGFTCSDGVLLVSNDGPSSRINYIVGELQIDNAVRHGHGVEAVDLAHQAGSLHCTACGRNLQEVRHGLEPAYVDL